MNRIARGLLFALLWTPGDGAPAQEAARNPVGDRDYPASVRSFLDAHCRECHQGEKPKGDFRIDQLDPTFTAKTAEERWRAVLEQIQAGAMPPKKKTRPPEPDCRALTAWIRGRLDSVEAARHATEGRVVLRRLNRLEYTNTLRDLLDVRVDLKEEIGRAHV